MTEQKEEDVVIEVPKQEEKVEESEFTQDKLTNKDSLEDLSDINEKSYSKYIIIAVIAAIVVLVIVIGIKMKWF